MSHLRVRPAPAGADIIHRITPQSAGWTYVGFELRHLPPAGRLEADAGDREQCLVLISGTARIRVDGQDFGAIGGRAGPFAGLPDSVYVPAGSRWSAEASERAEIAICSAPGRPGRAARRIPPQEVGEEVRGRGTNTRHVRNILPEGSDADSLLVVEVITPGGHWSSYPPHKHDRDALPAESLLEETYYHRINPPQGYAVQRVYTDDRSLDETILVEDGDVVLVPRGYHPVGAAHGYDLYYLNVMAGPHRQWRFHNDPAHEWIVRTPA